MLPSEIGYPDLKIWDKMSDGPDRSVYDCFIF